MSEHTPLRPRQVLGRLLLVLSGLTWVPFGVVEGSLRLASCVAVRAPAASKPGASLCVLCVGDSHTYGAYFPEALSYPRRLEAHLRQTLGPGVSVETDCLPGRTAATALRRLPAALSEVRPAVTILLAGLNDRWNRADDQLGWWWSLRTFRLFAMARHQRVNGSDSHEIVAEDPLADAELERRIERHMAGMIERCRLHDSIPLVLTYAAPDPPLVAPNRALRAAARKSNAELLDLEACFQPLLESVPYERLLIPDDYHPRPEGYEEIARMVARCVLELVGRAGSESFAPAPEREAKLELEADPTSLGRLRMKGPACSTVRIYLSAARSPPVAFDRFLLPIGADRLFLATRHLEALTTKTDAAGVALLDLDLQPLAGEVETLYAVAVHLADDPSRDLEDEKRWRSVSDAIEIDVR